MNIFRMAIAFVLGLWIGWLSDQPRPAKVQGPKAIRTQTYPLDGGPVMTWCGYRGADTAEFYWRVSGTICRLEDIPREMRPR